MNPEESLKAGIHPPKFGGFWDVEIEAMVIIRGVVKYRILSQAGGFVAEAEDGAGNWLPVFVAEDGNGHLSPTVVDAFLEIQAFSKILEEPL